MATGSDDTGWTFEAFARLVGRMRAAQRAYYRGRRRVRPEEQHRLLTKSLDAEAAVDAALERLREDRERPLFARDMAGD